MRNASLLGSGLVLLLAGTNLQAQPPGITMEMINTTLPEEGAPQAVPGAYEVTTQEAFEAPRYVLRHPSDLSAFPDADHLPVLVWGNGGCAIDNTRIAGFLETIASHGFLAITTQALAGEEQRQQSPEDLSQAIDWAESENSRSGSPFEGKIDTSQVAVMGQSCGGFLSVTLGADPRVDTIGVFNSGVQPADPESSNPGRGTSEMLAEINGPVLFINGHERDFMMQASRDNFEQIDHVATFYGARHDAGHTATVYHPGGGEYANVASNWLRYHFKDDAEAGAMFVGEDCSLCQNPNWETDSKGLE